MKRISDEELQRVSGDAAMKHNLPNKTAGQSYIQRIAQAQLDSCENEHREEVKEIFEEIEEHLTLTYDPDGSTYSISKLSWQALKQEVLKCQK